MSLDQQFFNNSIQDWLIAILIAVFLLGGLKIIIAFIRRKLRKIAPMTKTGIDNLLLKILGRTKFFFLLFFSFFAASQLLELPDNIKRIISTVFILGLLFQSGLWSIGLINFITERYKEEKLKKDAAGATTFTALSFLAKIVLWSVILLLALDNLGFNITTLVAGLGISGIAIALAVQNILGDLLASLSIVLDKPFVLGDLIYVDEHIGYVEHIGLKTTRIRSLSGEELIFSNNDLLQSRIRNFRRMAERRINFAIGVTYQTPVEKLKKIPGIVKEIIDKQENARFDRAHFKTFADFSLNFEIVYWILGSDYKLYMDIQQSINLQIYRRFGEEAIEFAYPTQTLFIEKQ